MARAADAVPAAARRAAVHRRLRHVRAGRRATSRTVQEHGLPAASTATTTTPTPSTGSGARWPSAPQPTVPCNNDLLAGNFIDDGEQVWLIDYEYSGNNDACFELGNTATECDLDADQVEALVDGVLRARRRARDAGPGAAAGAGVGSTAGRCGAAIQAAASPLDFDFHGVGHGAVREGRARRSPRAGFERLLEEVDAVTTDLPVPRPGRGRRRRRDRRSASPTT